MRIWLKQFFSLSETTTSYKRPIIKLLLFPIIFLLIFFRPKFGITLIDGAVTVASIICLYFAVVCDTSSMHICKRCSKLRSKKTAEECLP